MGSDTGQESEIDAAHVNDSNLSSGERKQMHWAIATRADARDSSKSSRRADLERLNFPLVILV
jgi:hypothetical protein